MNDFLEYTKAEEIANSITHGVGVLLSIAGLVILVVYASLHCGAPDIVSASIFGSSLIILYLASTLYHAIPNPICKARLQRFDHSAIYILIAGTYTPFALSVIKGASGWTVFGVIWGLAVTGIVFKLFFINKFEKLSLFLYIAMGWICLFVIKQIAVSVPTSSLVFLILGGIFYTAGTIFYASDKLFFNHAIWHVFVLCGSILHFFSILTSFTGIAAI